MSGSRNEYQYKTLPQQFCRCGKTGHMGRESALEQKFNAILENPFGGLLMLKYFFYEREQEQRGNTERQNTNRISVSKKGRKVLEKEHIFKMKEKETQGTQTRIAHIVQISLISYISQIPRVMKDVYT